jgi:hypothetical protein
VSGKEQLAAVSLLLAAAELLRDPRASAPERERIAKQIDRFVHHEDVDEELLAVPNRRPRLVQR